MPQGWYGHSGMPYDYGTCLRLWHMFECIVLIKCTQALLQAMDVILSWLTVAMSLCQCRSEEVCVLDDPVTA